VTPDGDGFDVPSATVDRIDDPDELGADGPIPVPRCSVAARGRADALAGTALPTDRFLLVEDPGPWGPAPHPVGTLPPTVVEHVHEQARVLQARLLLIRRTGRSTATDHVRTWAYVDTTRARVRTGDVDHPDALASVDFAVDGHEGEQPWYLVCTQGRHDVCCAVYGRPVVDALARLAPDRTWECTHVGGDRFAANVVLMPAGLVYGHVDVTSVEELTTAYVRGRVVPRLLRGRCGTVPAAQVAEHHARELLHDERLDAFAPPQVTHAGHDRWQVDLVHDGTGQRLRAVLLERHEDVAIGLTCAATGPGRLRSWDLLSLDRIS
jgi:hypothetical protein